jgi:hypothetical protein
MPKNQAEVMNALAQQIAKAGKHQPQAGPDDLKQEVLSDDMSI